ncbi:MAG: helix-turn-helix domain-containing protein [Microbacterium sp.]
MTDEPRVLDAGALKAYAHPLRVRILDLLIAYGPQTASSLAELTGESSGSTSYHLRILAKHDLVREIEGRDGRERRWERAKGSVSFTRFSVADTPADRAVVQVTTAEVHRRKNEESFDYFTRRALLPEEPKEWTDVAMSTQSSFRLTAAQTKQLVARLQDVLAEFQREFANQEGEDARLVAFNAEIFPRENSRGATRGAKKSQRSP